MMCDGTGLDGRAASEEDFQIPQECVTRGTFLLIYQCGNVSSATDCSDGLRLVRNGSMCTLRTMLAAESLLICAPLQFPGLE